jgi:hypothetical protein
MIPFPFYPFIFSIFPSFTLLSQNSQQTSSTVVFAPAIASVVGTAVFYLLLCLVFKNWSKAAQVTLVFIFFFFTYGHVYNLLEEKSVAGFLIGRHRILAPLWGLLWLGFTIWLIRRPPFSPVLVTWLNALSILMFIIPLNQIVFNYLRQNQSLGQVKVNRESSTPVLQSSAAKNAITITQPDIYYIILDGHTRSDTLKKNYQVDNSAFINQLENLGFVLPACAQSNYAWTPFSMSSSLNMDYLDEIEKMYGIGIESTDTITLGKIISNSLVRRNLAQRGYRFVSFATDYPFLNIEDADYFITQDDNPLDVFKSGLQVSFFEKLFLRTTALRLASESIDALGLNIGSRVKSPEEARYEYILWFLDQLEIVPDLPGPKFVYAHLTAPHEPYVINAEGEFEYNLSVRPGYGEQLTYIDQRIIPIIETILKKSKTPPIIILQGDHGRDMEDRMQILNAYYLPNGGKQKIYSTITPVNSFRVIFDYYFNGDYPFLDDVSYFSSDENQDLLTVVEAVCEE